MDAIHPEIGKANADTREQVQGHGSKVHAH
jgi:hypothetical protein